MEIVDAKLTLKCEDGTELKADMTDAKVAAIVLLGNRLVSMRGWHIV